LWNHRDDLFTFLRLSGLDATPKVEYADRSRARKRAKRLAEDAGFVWYDGGRTWVCPACRIRRLPDKVKAEFPKLCERYGIPVPVVQPEQPPTRSVRRRQWRVAKGKETPPAPGHPPEAGGKRVP
jgi:hypothetical protein